MTSNCLTKKFSQNFSVNNIGSESFTKEQTDKLLYEYRMKLKLVAKESTRMIVKAEDIEKMDQPEFLGKIGVNMNDLEYYIVKKSAQTPSKL